MTDYSLRYMNINIFQELSRLRSRFGFFIFRSPERPHPSLLLFLPPAHRAPAPEPTVFQPPVPFGTAKVRSFFYSTKKNFTFFFTPRNARKPNAPKQPQNLTQTVQKTTANSKLLTVSPFAGCKSR
ncbi:hypothetical protein SAMN05660226_03915, partial [Parapedobacter luteus]